jgi:hypothetical protein
MHRASVHLTALAAGAALWGFAGESFALSECEGDLTDRVVIVPIKGPDTPSSAVMPRSTLIQAARKMRDWFEENSYGCYTPNIWLDQMRVLPQPMSSYTKATLTDAIDELLRCGGGTTDPCLKSYYGDPQQIKYLTVVMGGGDITPHETFAFSGVCEPKDDMRFNYPTCLHELLHMMGLDHLSDLECSGNLRQFGNAPWDPTRSNGTLNGCSTDKYSSQGLSVLGGAIADPNKMPHLTGYQKYYLGFIHTDKVLSLKRQSGSDQFYSVQLHSSSQALNSSPQLISIQISESGLLYPRFWIEYRTRTGFDTALSTSDGKRVHIYYQPWQDSTISFYNDSDSFADTGVPFLDANTGIRISMGNALEESTTVEIEIPHY